MTEWQVQTLNCSHYRLCETTVPAGQRQVGDLTVCDICPLQPEPDGPPRPVAPVRQIVDIRLTMLRAHAPIFPVLWRQQR